MSATKERRSGLDRRMDNGSGPPLGWRDRRRSVERRFPEVIETSLSLFEWQEYFAAWKNDASARAALAAAARRQDDKGPSET